MRTRTRILIFLGCSPWRWSWCSRVGPRPSRNSRCALSGNQAEKDPLDAIRGSSAKGGDVDVAVVLRIVLVHPSLSVTIGNASEHLTEAIIRLEELNRWMADLLTARTGRPRALVEAWLCDPDLLFTAKRAVDEGLADAVI